MKKRVMALMLTFALACGMMAGCGKGAEEKGELNLYTWKASGMKQPLKRQC